MPNPDTYGIYLHIPYCRSKCRYCDFYSAPGTRGVPDEYVTALLRELSKSSRRPDTLYFGGGTPALLRLLNTKEDLLPGAILYLRVYFLGMPALALYNFGNAIFSAIGDTKKPLYFLSIAGVLNILLNLFFVIVCKLDVMGVALASAISQCVSAGLILHALTQVQDCYTLHFREARLDPAMTRSILALGLPAGFQNAVFAIANLFIQAGVNSFDSLMVKGNSAAANADAMIYDCMAAFYMACASFMSQNYGAGNLARCRRATWVSMGLNFCASVMMIAVVLIFERSILSLFTHSEAVMEIAITRILLVVLAEPISVVMETVSDAMRGYGYSMPPAMVTLFCICSIRIVWVYTVFAADPTFDTLMIVYPISWAVTTAALTWLYFRHQKMLTAKHAHSRATSPEALPFTD